MARTKLGSAASKRPAHRLAGFSVISRLNQSESTISNDEPSFC
jgi:hypothetical protein